MAVAVYNHYKRIYMNVRKSSTALSSASPTLC